MTRDAADPPRVPIHRRMSVGEYRDYPRHPGWKYEYRGGALHVTSAGLVVPMTLEPGSARLPALRAFPATTFRRLAAGDDRALQELFVEAFEGTMEYAGVPREEIRVSAEESLTRGCRKRRGPRHEISYVAEEGGRPTAAALFRQGNGAPLLDLLFVSPLRRRRGLASALAGLAVRDFAALGERRIWSSAMLGNLASLAWHERFGFEEIPHVLVAKHRRHIYRYELERHRRLGDRTAPEMAALESRVAFWETEARRLDELLAENPRAAFPNIY